jgi:hypothetical protein
MARPMGRTAAGDLALTPSEGRVASTGRPLLGKSGHHGVNSSRHRGCQPVTHYPDPTRSRCSFVSGQLRFPTRGQLRGGIWPPEVTLSKEGRSQRRSGVCVVNGTVTGVPLTGCRAASSPRRAGRACGAGRLATEECQRGLLRRAQAAGRRKVPRHLGSAGVATTSNNRGGRPWGILSGH